MRLVTLVVTAALAIPMGVQAAEVSDQAIEQLAEARAVIEQQAPVTYARIIDERGFPELSAEERQQMERALAGTDLSFDRYVELEREVRKDESARRRLGALEARSAAHGGGAPGGDATRDAPPGLSGAVPAPSAPGGAAHPAHQSYQDQHKEREAQKPKSK